MQTPEPGQPILTPIQWAWGHPYSPFPYAPNPATRVQLAMQILRTLQQFGFNPLAQANRPSNIPISYNPTPAPPPGPTPTTLNPLNDPANKVDLGPGFQQILGWENHPIGHPLDSVASMTSPIFQGAATGMNAGGSAVAPNPYIYPLFRGPQ